jgi:hypothetical protein
MVAPMGLCAWNAEQRGGPRLLLWIYDGRYIGRANHLTSLQPGRRNDDERGMFARCLLVRRGMARQHTAPHWSDCARTKQRTPTKRHVATSNVIVRHAFLQIKLDDPSTAVDF